MFKIHYASVLIGLILTSLVEADNGRYEHWSEGVYFPPPTSSVETPMNRYPGVKKRRYNPWAVSEEGKTRQQLPTAESLGYPNEDYSPYQSSAVGRTSTPGPANTYAPGTRYPPAAGRYYPSQYGDSGAVVNAYPPEHEKSLMGQGYEPNTYPPTYGSETYHPVYGTGLYPWFSPYPLYGSSFFFMPDW